MDFVLLFVSLGIILAAAEIFTNSVEWLGLRLTWLKAPSAASWRRWVQPCPSP